MNEADSLGRFNGHDIYPMPMLVMLQEADVEAAVDWCEAALGFSALPVARGRDGRIQLAHLRRACHQDLLLLPGEATREGQASTLSLRADRAREELEPSHPWGPRR